MQAVADWYLAISWYSLRETEPFCQNTWCQIVQTNSIIANKWFVVGVVRSKVVTTAYGRTDTRRGTKSEAWVLTECSAYGIRDKWIGNGKLLTSSTSVFLCQLSLHQYSVTIIIHLLSTLIIQVLRASLLNPLKKGAFPVNPLRISVIWYLSMWTTSALLPLERQNTCVTAYWKPA